MRNAIYLCYLDYELFNSSLILNNDVVKLDYIAYCMLCVCIDMRLYRLDLGFLFLQVVDNLCMKTTFTNGYFS